MTRAKKSRPEVPPLERAVSDLYDAALGAATWEEAIDAVAREFSSIYGIAFSAAPDGSAIHWVHNSGNDPSARNEYVAAYAPLDPLLPRAVARAGHADADQALMPRREYERSAIFNEFLSRYDTTNLLGSVFLSSPQRIVGLSVQRPGSYEARETERMQGLVPHLQRAIRIADLVERQHWQTLALQGALQLIPFGVVVISCEQRVLFGNADGLRLLQSIPGASLRDGALHLATATVTRALKAELGRIAHRLRTTRVADSGYLSIARAPPASALRVAIIPFRERSLDLEGVREGTIALCLFDERRLPASSEQILFSLFGLTPREAQVALALSSGASVRQAAERLNVSHETARNHLKRALHKTGARNQAALVRLVITSPLQLLTPEAGTRGGGVACRTIPHACSQGYGPVRYLRTRSV